MSKGKDRHSKVVAEKVAERRAMERGVWGAILLIVGFVLLIWFLVARETFGEAIVGAVVAVLGWVNFVAFKVYRGSKIAVWQHPLAIVPLQFAGYGSGKGKPLEAAKGESKARNAIIVFLGVSMVIVVLLALLMIPDLRQ